MVWKLDASGTTLVAQRAVPLRFAYNAPESEAAAAADAIHLLISVVNDLPATEGTLQIEIQGDNTAVIGYWNGDSRFRSVRMHDKLEHARHAARTRLPSLIWTYIPRECNATADHLAGLASSLVMEWRQKHHIPIETLGESSGPYQDLERSGLNSFPEAESPCPDVQWALQANRVWERLAGSFRGAQAIGGLFMESVPHRAWDDIPLAREVIPQKMHGIVAYFAASQVIRHGAGVPARYVTKAGRSFGRLYADSPAGQCLSRPARYLLFGLDHYEIDIEGAHFAFALSMIHSKFPNSLHAELDCVDSARKLVLKLLAGSPICRTTVGFQKHLWILATNSGASTAKSFVIKHNVVAHPRLFDIIDTYCRLLEACLLSLPPLPQDESINHRNHTYFQLEKIEAQYMQHLMHFLFLNEPPTSAMLIHDGIWVCPQPSHQVVAQAAAYASKASGMSRVRVKVTDLKAERRDIVQRIREARIVAGKTNTFSVDLKNSLAYLTRDAWWECMHENYLLTEHTPGIAQLISNAVPLRNANVRTRKRDREQLDNNQESLEKFFTRRRLIL